MEHNGWASNTRYRDPTFPELPHLFIPTFLCPPPTVRKLSISLALLISSVFLLSCTYLRLSPVIWKRHARMSHRHIRGHDRRWEWRISCLWRKCVGHRCRHLCTEGQASSVIFWWFDHLHVDILLLFGCLSTHPQTPVIYNYMTRIWRRGKGCPPCKVIHIQTLDSTAGGVKSWFWFSLWVCG